MNREENDRAYLQRRRDAENRLAEEARDPSVSAAHKRLARLYEERLQQIGGGEILDGEGSIDGAASKVELARARQPEFPAEYAKVRSEVAEELGEDERSAEWRTAAERLAGEDGPDGHGEE